MFLNYDISCVFAKIMSDIKVLSIYSIWSMKTKKNLSFRGCSLMKSFTEGGRGVKGSLDNGQSKQIFSIDVFPYMRG